MIKWEKAHTAVATVALAGAMCYRLVCTECRVLSMHQLTALRVNVIAGHCNDNCQNACKENTSYVRFVLV